MELLLMSLWYVECSLPLGFSFVYFILNWLWPCFVCNLHHSWRIRTWVTRNSVLVSLVMHPMNGRWPQATISSSKKRPHISSWGTTHIAPVFPTRVSWLRRRWVRGAILVVSTSCPAQIAFPSRFILPQDFKMTWKVAGSTGEYEFWVIQKVLLCKPRMPSMSGLQFTC